MGFPHTVLNLIMPEGASLSSSGITGYKNLLRFLDIGLRVE
jgi:hypothetical protein